MSHVQEIKKQNPGFTVLDGGFFTTVQDFGRTGYQQYGITVSGAVDRRSYLIANLLAGNSNNEAALEATIKGPTIRFDCDCVIAVTGGDLGFTMNGTPFPMYRAVYVRKGDVLCSGLRKTGCRAYISFSGGIDVPPIMGSRSTYVKAALGGFEGRKLKKDDCLPLLFPGRIPPNLRKRFVTPEDFSGNRKTVRVILGPQDNLFTEEGLHTFLTEPYTVSNQCDRMGYRLDGTVIDHIRDANIVSDGISFGAIQVPGEGKPIIMLSDKQTTGGYTKIATVISADIPIVSQCIPGDRLHFRAISVQEAQEVYMDVFRSLHSLQEELDSPEPPAISAAEHFTVMIAGSKYDVTVEPAE